MYRIVGVLAERRGIALDDDAALDALVAGLEFTAGAQGIQVASEPVGPAIRTAEAGELASRVSTRAPVRRRLVEAQRRLGREADVVMEGRDIGTVVFADAPLKIFLTADPGERARRRAAELRARGDAVDVEALARDLARRDERDRSRADSPLRPAGDAHVLDTTALTLAEVVDRMAALARRAFGIASRT